MKDWLERALKTFVQAFVGILVVNGATILSGLQDLSNWQTWLLPIIESAIAAGISAAWNFILEYSNKKEQQKALEEFNSNNIDNQ